jgi:threonine dehydrogenase-like Zn-dependent dehydrogenase
VLVGGVGCTFECLGKSSTLDDALRLTSPGGKVVVVGVPGLARGIDWSAVFIKELTVIGSYIYDHVETWRGQTSSTFAIALEMMANGIVDLGWMITHRYRLEESDTAFRQIANKKNHPVIKPVFEFPEG